MTIFENQGARQLSAWLLRMASDPVYRLFLYNDPHLFSTLYACCSASVAPPEKLSDVPESASMEGNNKIFDTLKALQQQFGSAVSGRFAQQYVHGLDVYNHFENKDEEIIELMQQWQADAKNKAAKAISVQEKNVERLAQLLELSKTEKNIFLLQLNSMLPGFNYLFDILFSTDEFAFQILALMLNTDSSDIINALDDSSTLIKSGLLTIQRRPLRLSRPSENMRSALLESDSDDEFAKIFVKPLQPKPSTASLARLDDRDQEILLRLMNTNPTREHPINVLFYGPKNIDKRTALAKLFQDNDLEAYSLASDKVPPSDMPAWAFIGQSWIKENAPQAIMVLDRAEHALSAQKVDLMSLFGLTDGSNDEIEKEKASDSGILSSSINCVWISEQPRSLSENVLGQFIFHCQAQPGSRGERKERIEQVINEFELSPELESHLSRFSLLGENQVRQAANLAKLMHAEDDHQEAREETIKRAIQQSQKILDREETEDLRDSVTNYSLDNLNLNGKFSPDKIIQALRKRPKGTLCFYGIPGAGKTQLAEYMAVELDKPIMMKRASDILSKWLGESEQNIAQIFAEAEAENALLLLDEADSFLRDRALARAEWSVTQVNELLQQMERFNGIFIAATNLFQDIDAAALRRFTWKVEFLPLTSEQAWQMFISESGIDFEKTSKKEIQRLQTELESINNLAPGDFATIKRQALMLDEQLDPDEWLEQLELEAKAKMTGLTRNKLGFD